MHAVVVDAKAQKAKAFYEKYRFVPLLDNEHHPYLQLATIRASLPKP